MGVKFFCFFMDLWISKEAENTLSRNRDMGLTLQSWNAFLKNILTRKVIRANVRKWSTVWFLEVKLSQLFATGPGCTVKKKPSVTQDQNTMVTENSIIHIERLEKSVNTRDWAYWWRNFSSPLCCGPASRLAFLTVWITSAVCHREK
jgi:hypothetical protein